ncbi:MAG TPA: hypothetical protein VL443_26185 [Cyclobacteriaceae bacterium]|nr:hypothetical protein [Cyclobacteriaceae bacterium]
MNKLISGDNTYKTTVDKVLVDVHDLAKGSKNLYEVDKDKVSIIIRLNNSGKEYFAEINPSKITTSNYKRVLTFLQG